MGEEPAGRTTYPRDGALGHMTRLFVEVEGQTEESFVNEVLGPHLIDCGFTKVAPTLLGNARKRYLRGGIKAWSNVRRDIVRLLQQDRACYVTTMVDFYGLPQSGGKKWPGRAEANAIHYPDNVRLVEAALMKDIEKIMGSGFNPKRFSPFVIMHEFEGLLFSDCHAFAHAIGRPDITSKLQEIKDKFSNPEEINDSKETTPSKRIQNLLPGYEKPLLGTLAASKIGLAKIRSSCPHFGAWLEQLEGLP